MTSTRAYIDRVVDLLAYSVSKSRFDHSRRVAECCGDIGNRYGLDVDRCILAGWAHDLAREWSAQALLRYAVSEHAIEIDPAESANPLLLHGHASAGILSKEIGVDDEEVLSAVRYHTLGIPGFCDIGKALYCADYLEPNRPGVPEGLRRIVGEVTLDELVSMVITDTRRRGFSIAERTEAMYRALTNESGAS